VKKLLANLLPTFALVTSALAFGYYGPGPVVPAPDPGVINVRAMGAQGDGVTDDTAAIQGAINAAPPGGSVYIPFGTYLISAALTVTQNITIKGVGVYPVIAPLATHAQFSLPDVSPYLQGSVILQTAAATDAIDITGTALAVYLHDFGIRFADSIKFVNTGHGINYTPSTMYNGGHEQGLQMSTWANLMVFGHDGNHYAYHLTNTLEGTFNSLYSFGGGLFYGNCDSGQGNDGNFTGNMWFGFLIQLGTANGIDLEGSGSGPGIQNMISLTRPQVNIISATGIFPTTTSPVGGGQQALYMNSHLGQYSIIEPDFEPASSAPITLNNSQRFITKEGAMGTSTNGFWTSDIPVFQSNRVVSSDLLLSGYGTTSGTAAAGANAGSSPPTPSFGSHGDYAGQVCFGTGTGPTAGAMAQINFVNANGTVYTLGVQPTNAAAAGLGVAYVTKASNDFILNVPNAPAASQANSTYCYDYQIRKDG
jgi:Pectate lyase superfamily protein